MIEYNAKGKLIGCFSLNGQEFIILVQLSAIAKIKGIDVGPEYVVSRYQNGATEWQSGRYTGRLETALAWFATTCQKASVSVPYGV